MKKCIINNNGSEADISESKHSAYSVINKDNEETDKKLVVMQEQTGLNWNKRVTGKWEKDDASYHPSKIQFPENDGPVKSLSAVHNGL
jgi:hypothetical protein